MKRRIGFGRIRRKDDVKNIIFHGRGHGIPHPLIDYVNFVTPHNVKESCCNFTSLRNKAKFYLMGYLMVYKLSLSTALFLLLRNLVNGFLTCSFKFQTKK